MKKILNLALCATVACGIFASCENKNEGPEVTGIDPSTIATENLIVYINFEDQAVDQITKTAPTKVGKGVSYVEGHHKLGKALTGASANELVYDAVKLGIDKAKSFTTAMWVKQAPIPQTCAPVPCYYTMTDGEEFWGTYTFTLDRGGLDSTDSLRVKIAIQGSYWADYGLNQGLPSDQWAHVVVTWDGDKKEIHTYVNGVVPEVFATAEEGFNTNFPENQAEIKYADIKYLILGQWRQKAINDGTDDWMGDINGALDEFRLYNTALTANQVKQLYLAEISNVPEN